VDAGRRLNAAESHEKCRAGGAPTKAQPLEELSLLPRLRRIGRMSSAYGRPDAMSETSSSRDGSDRESRDPQPVSVGAGPEHAGERNPTAPGDLGIIMDALALVEWKLRFRDAPDVASIIDLINVLRVRITKVMTIDSQRQPKQPR
jgi:hypothetical protein